MRIKYYLSICVGALILLANTATAQLFVIENADMYFQKRRYAEAATIYEELGTTKKGEIYIYKSAECYRHMKNYEKSAETYLKIVGNPAVPHDAHLYCGHMLMYCGRYKEALEQYKLYAAGNPTSKYENLPNYLASPEWAEKHQKDTIYYEIGKFVLQVNAFYMGGAGFQKDFFYYSNSEKEPNAEKPSYKFALSNYEGDSIDQTTYADSIQTQFYIGYPTFSSDFFTMYFTKNDTEKEKARKGQYDEFGISSAGYNTTNIYEAKLYDGKWSQVKEVNFNSREWDDSHPFISTDGRRLYFTSNRPGGIGGFDLYYCVKDGDSWSDPINMGSGINTVDDEMNPFILNDTMLYFSSNGMIGFGGADIYYAKGSEGKWGKPVNMGKGFNSPKDDFGIFVYEGGKKGFFASNRNTAPGQDEIFTFEKTIEFKKGIGIVSDKLYGKRLEGAYVLVYEKDSLIDSVSTNILGSYQFERFNPDLKYKLMAKKDGYKPKELAVDPKKTDLNSLNFELEATLTSDVVLTFKDILFEYDKADLLYESTLILDRLATVLLANPEATVELGAHTDSRGSDSYNLTLSQKRAESAVKYLVSKGVPETRLIAKGYGEKELKNKKCKNGVTCSEEEHQENRRVEIKVVGVKKATTN